jgi:hypothetical protein
MNDQVEPRAGTFADWNINVAGVQGQQGSTGGPGPQGPMGNPGPIGSGYQATSTTSLPLATGSVTVFTQSGLAYTTGARVRLSSSGTPTSWMEGLVSSYSGSTLVVNVDLISAAAVPVVFPSLPGYIGGLTLANDATTPATVIDVAMGAATSDDFTTLINLTAAMTKSLNAAWSVGSGNGALDSGSAIAAATTYHIFLIERMDTFVVDILASTNATNPALPLNYTKRRRIGSVMTTASATIFGFIQVGDDFNLNPPINSTANSGAGTTATAFAISTPKGIKTVAHFCIDFVNPQTTGSSLTITHGDMPGSTYGSPGGNADLANTAAQGYPVAGDFYFRTDAVNATIWISASASLANGIYIVTKGWRDNRGK